MGDIKVREYRAHDVEAMFALDSVCFAEVFRFSRRAMRRFAEAYGAITLVAVTEDGTRAGFVIAHVEGNGKERYGYIVTLDVAPDWRRSGLGGRLMREAEQRLAERGMTTMALHVFAKNKPAITFYERAGYARVGLETGFYGAGLDAFVYAKALDGLS